MYTTRSLDYRTAPRQAGKGMRIAFVSFSSKECEMRMQTIGSGLDGWEFDNTTNIAAETGSLKTKEKDKGADTYVRDKGRISKCMSGLQGILL